MNLSDILVATTGAGLFMLFIGVVVVVFQVVLFFKVWAMTDDISKIRQLFERVVEAEYEEVNTLTKKSNFWSLNTSKSTKPTENDDNSQ